VDRRVALAQQLRRDGPDAVLVEPRPRAGEEVGGEEAVRVEQQDGVALGEGDPRLIAAA
jgi:hypothetical protein